jgi:branched-chain amino acid transport system ATP-binding protein
LASEATVALALTDVDAFYGDSRVLHRVSLRLGEGRLLGLLGRNGAGKSTSMNVIVGLLPPRHGEVSLYGGSVTGRAPETIAAQGVALVPQGRRIVRSLTVRENLAVAARVPRGGRRLWTLDSVYATFPRLRERASQIAASLSGGEQQMLAIGRALVTNPHLLILDEATEGLAPLLREEIWRCLERLRAEGQTILVVDKYIDRLVKLANRHTIIERGRVAWQGSSAELDADRGLWHRYLGV